MALLLSEIHEIDSVLFVFFHLFELLFAKSFLVQVEFLFDFDQASFDWIVDSIRLAAEVVCFDLVDFLLGGTSGSDSDLVSHLIPFRKVGMRGYLEVCSELLAPGFDRVID